MEYIFSIAARSLIRHAVVGALTGGTGNALILAGDMMNISDTVDAIDAIDEIDVVDAGSSYGSGSHHDVLVTGIYWHILRDKIDIANSHTQQTEIAYGTPTPTATRSLKVALGARMIPPRHTGATG